MFVKGKSINDDGKGRPGGGSPAAPAEPGAQAKGGAPAQDGADAGRKRPQQKKRKSIIRSLRNSIAAMTGAGGSKSEDAQVKKKMAAKKEEDARRERCGRWGPRAPRVPSEDRRRPAPCRASILTA